MQFTYRWPGNAGFGFRFGTIILLIDPFLTRPKQAQIYYGRVTPDKQAIKAHIQACDYILVSHAGSSPAIGMTCSVRFPSRRGLFSHRPVWRCRPFKGLI